MNINLHIDRLVLDGVSVELHQRSALKVAVESELRRLLIAKGVGSKMQSNEETRLLSGGSISVGNCNEPSLLGQSIARAIYGGIGS